ncbi:hypothetical protein DM860_003446 [Cuscuta australis]|uniref:Transcription termination factor MTEF1, chloroplastic n=1 Tax=Cuscuta australis TaxID=267555 RepID=A0A328DG32_9ASTE|nr:hypothetical protein DM860_003446 [Cuscuta australis]
MAPPPAAAALLNPSSIFISAHKPSSSSSSSSDQVPNSPLVRPAKPKPLILQEQHPPHTLQLKDKILCLETMGVDSGQALSQNPSLHAAPLHSLLSFLLSKGIHQNDLRRIFGMCPDILTSDIESHLNPVFLFLSQDLHIPHPNFRRVIKKCPRLLVSSPENQLKPALFFLKSLGIKDLQSLAYQDPVLLVSSVENTLVPKLDYLASLGFSRTEVAGMVVRCPGLLTFSIENNFKPKFRYFADEMGRGLEELKEFPQYFTFSLEKRIKKRHMEAVQRGVVEGLPLGMMLKTSDEEFCHLMMKNHQRFES